MSKFRKQSLTVEDRLAQAKTQIKQLTNIIKKMKEMIRKGSHVEQEIEALTLLIQSTRDKFKSIIEEYERKAS
jgi:glutaredoxin 2